MSEKLDMVTVFYTECSNKLIMFYTFTNLALVLRRDTQDSVVSNDDRRLRRTAQSVHNEEPYICRCV